MARSNGLYLHSRCQTLVKLNGARSWRAKISLSL